MLSGILVELDEPRGDVSQPGGGDRVVSLLPQFFPADASAARRPQNRSDEVLHRLAFRVLLQHAQPLGDLADHLVVAHRLTQGLDAPIFREEQIHLATEHVVADIILFKHGVDRQDDVGEQAVVLQPRMLSQHELDVGGPYGLDVVVPAFQQVIQDGESVQIMWILEQPSAGILVVDELVLARSELASFPYQST